MVLEGSEQELVESCRRGERDAMRALFEAYKDKVYSIALRFSGDPSTAMDMAQDAFLKLFSAIRDFRGNSSLDTWIYRIVVNSCLDHKRRVWRLIPLADEFVATLRASGDSLTEAMKSEVRDRIWSAVNELAPDLRIAIVLRYTEGLSYAEIAEVLGAAEGTIASRLSRAHKELEKRLAYLVGNKGGSHA